MTDRARVAIFNNTATGGHFGCSAVMSTIEAELLKRGFEIELSWPVDFDWRLHKGFLKSRNIDCVIVNGEGSIHHTETRVKAMYLCELASFARKELGVPAFLVNSTMDALCSQALEHIALFDGVYVRESRTRAYLAERGVKSSSVPDLSIFSPMIGFIPPCARGPLVTDSVLPGASEELARFATSTGWEFMKMEHVARPTLFNRALSKFRQRLVSPEAISKFERRQRDDRFDDFIRRLAGSEALITGRFHSVMLSMAVETPFLALESNTPKISAVIGDALGSSDRIISAECLREKVPADLWLQRSRFSQGERKRLREYKARGAKEMKEMFDEIMKLGSHR